MFGNLRIRARLYASFAIVVAVLVVLVAVTLRSLLALEASNAMNVHTYQVLAEGKAMLESLINIETGQRGFSLTGNEASLEPYVQGQQEFDRHLAAARQLTSDNAAQQERLGRLEAARQQWIREAIDPAIALRRGVATGAATLDGVSTLERQGKGKAAMDAMRQVLAAFGSAESDLLKERAAQSEALSTQTRNIMLGGGVLAALIAAVVARGLANNITVPVGEAVLLAQKVARGDLTGHIETTSTDEIGDLMLALRDMNGSLARIVTQVRQGTGTIATASAEIAAGNLDLSSRTEEQASSLEETASSMEQLTSTVRQNAENARNASDMAGAAGTMAAEGGDIVGRVVQTMGRIHASSTRVVDIVGVIDSIAFQTNILALNAAVEAARAGEQGRGFAVVASEVRTLAQRAATAAREIKDLIGEAVQEVDTGSALVGQAGQTIGALVTRVQNVGTIVTEISKATDEQLAGIQQVNDAIVQMDNVTQQNAALVEQAAAAANSMQDQAARLADLVRVFVVQDSGGHASVAPVSGVARRLVSPL